MWKHYLEETQTQKLMSMQWVATLIENAIDMNDNHHKLMKSQIFINNCTNWSHKKLIGGMQCGFFFGLLGQTCCPLPKFHILLPLLCNPNGFDIINCGSCGNWCLLFYLDMCQPFERPQWLWNLWLEIHC